MLDLADVPFFSRLTPDALKRVRSVTETRSFPAGAIVCRKGREGAAVYVVASGGVVVETGAAAPDGTGRVFLAPGEMFGEMSVVSGLPVSATVIAAKPTELHRIAADAFLALLCDEAALQRALSEMLIRRIHERTSSRSGAGQPSVALFVVGAESESVHRLVQGLFRGIRHYAPESSIVPVGRAFGTTESCVAPAAVEAIVRDWRASAGVGRYLVVIADSKTASQCTSQLERRDVVLTIDDPLARVAVTAVADMPEGLADRGVVEIVRAPGPRGASRAEWYFTVPVSEVDAALGTPDWDRRRQGDLDRIVRWIVRREIGIALGAGAARGFAHLGVIEVLEDAGIPIDCLAGSSMGGIVALLYALEGNSRATINRMDQLIGSNDKVIDVSWWPRSSLLLGSKVRKAARAAGGGLTIAQLERPAYVTAADLAGGKRVVIDCGRVDQAILATSAIPGFYPPVEREGQLLVDGALLSRLPANVLDRRRCGFTIAVNVSPSPSGDPARAAKLRSASNRWLGFRELLYRSWELLGWWHGASDAEQADVLIEPTGEASGYDFDAFAEMVDSGRRAAREKLELVRAGVTRVLGTDSDRV